MKYRTDLDELDDESERDLFSPPHFESKKARALKKIQEARAILRDLENGAKAS